jgi:hypothetical protein
MPDGRVIRLLGTTERSVRRLRHHHSGPGNRIGHMRFRPRARPQRAGLSFEHSRRSVIPSRGLSFHIRLFPVFIGV